MVRVDPEFSSMIPPLAADELRQLEANILAEGCREALVTWEGILLDGHNRYQICQRHGIPFKVEQVSAEVADREAARVWIRNNQLGRRNLTPAWRIELEMGNAGDLRTKGRKRQAEAIRDRDEKGRAEPVLSPGDKSGQRHNTRAEIAKRSGTSVGQVAMAEQVKKRDPELWERAKGGEISIKAAYQQIRSRDIRIDPEFNALLPPLRSFERAGLEANLRKDGCLGPLVVWKGKGILLDGHARLEICNRLGIEYRVKEIELADREEAIIWIINNQLGRANLSNPGIVAIQERIREREERQSKQGKDPDPKKKMPENRI
jgi:hypothetical protein